MKRIILSIFIASLLFSSCKKDNDTPPPTESVLDYFPLSVGNYWVYERYGCDSTWTDCTSKSIDTSFITKDTIIDGNTYFKIEGTSPVGQPSTSFFRDSLDYIVDNIGNIMFSSTDFDSKLAEEYIIVNETDTAFYWYYQMQKEPYNIEVDAGTFECLDNQMSFFRHQDDFEKEFNTHQLFAKEVGPVLKQAMFASSTSGFKQELIGYKIIPEDLKFQP